MSWHEVSEHSEIAHNEQTHDDDANDSEDAIHPTTPFKVFELQDWFAATRTIRTRVPGCVAGNLELWSPDPAHPPRYARSFFASGSVP